MTELLSPLELIFLERGRREGVQQGRQEGLEQGRQETTRIILEALEIRFGSVPPEIRTQIGQLRGGQLLRHAHQLAITTPSLEAFAENMPVDQDKD